MKRLTNFSCVATAFRKAGVFARVDDSGATIGKRYARNDELGTPYGVTLDFACKYMRKSTAREALIHFLAFKAPTNGTMTLRERDTTDQRIGKIDDVIAVVSDLVNGSIDWAEACNRLPAYDGVQAVD